MTSNITDELRAARAEIEKQSSNIWLADLAKQVQADLVAARAEIKRLKAEYDGMPTYNAVCQQMHDTEQELATARAEIERLKAELAKAKDEWP